MFFKKSIVLLFTVSALVLSGCNNKLYKQTEGNVADVAERSYEARQKSDTDAKAEPTLVVKQDAYVDRTPISIEHEPQWLKSQIVIRGEDLPFAYYSRLIVNGGGRNVLTRYQVGLDSNAKISMNYSGSVKGALDLLATKAGYVYEVHGHNVYWQAFVTKTFDIAFMPGSSDYMMGKVGGGSMMSASSGGGQNAVNGVIDDSAAAQYSNLKGTLSVWKDLENTIKDLMSPDGKVVVSEATTSVTVRDKPTNVELISKFISNLNNNLSKQVLVKVQVLEVNLSSDFNYGIDWHLIQRAFGGGGSNFVLNANDGQPVSITPLSATTNGVFPSFGIAPSKPDARTGFNILVNALTQQGKVSVVSEPRVVCLNNQVSSLRIVSQTGYLASVQNTTAVGSSGGGTGTGATLGTVTTQITPGTLVTGLTLYMLPKILGHKIFLQVNADISSSPTIRTISSTTGQAPNLTANPNPSSNIIQVPDVTQKQFNQRSVIGSGDTLILSGFRQISNTTGAMQLFDSQALGGKGATQKNTETVILITPVILHGTA